MERYTIFRDRKTQYHKDVSFLQFYRFTAILIKIAV